MRFSANLGLLWSDLPLPAAIRAAHRAGFDAVECHWPYDTPSDAVAAALTETGLEMLGINTARGREGEFGISALPGRDHEARAAIDQAIAYARAIGCGAIHVMAGNTEGEMARRTFVANLSYACSTARDLTFLVEPINHHDVPGYFLHSSQQAARIIGQVGQNNLKLMFDCYHLQIAEGDITRSLRALKPMLGHVQIASVPDRGAPDTGELDYRYIMGVLAEIGWTRPIGAEYRPTGGTERSLSWLADLRAI